MNEAVLFLQAFSQAIAASRFYPPEHPARARAAEQSYERLERLLELDQEPRFTILDGDVAYQQRVLNEFRGWEWGRKLEQLGIRRIEIDGHVSHDEFQRFLQEITNRLAGAQPSTLSRQFGSPSIRFGEIAVHDVEIELTRDDRAARPAVTGVGAEAAAVRWLHEEVKSGRELPMVEAEIIVRCLAVTMHREHGVMLPLLQLRDFDEYTTTHASNVAVLSMALAEYLGFAPAQVRTVGVCGLLHDIGKTRIPKDILTKPGKLTPEERAVIEQHTVEGARILLGRPDSLDIASVVAYEHHLLIDGGGYPRMKHTRGSHYASQIVHVCDVFDALCTHRPYRAAWTPDRALSTIEETSGTEFMPELVEAFAAMVRAARLEVSLLADVVDATSVKG